VALWAKNDESLARDVAVTSLWSRPCHASRRMNPGIGSRVCYSRWPLRRAQRQQRQWLMHEPGRPWRVSANTKKDRTMTHRFVPGHDGDGEFGVGVLAPTDGASMVFSPRTSSGSTMARRASEGPAMGHQRSGIGGLSAFSSDDLASVISKYHHVVRVPTESVEKGHDPLRQVLLKRAHSGNGDWATRSIMRSSSNIPLSGNL
jgi:hypothetical protein